MRASKVSPIGGISNQVIASAVISHNQQRQYFTLFFRNIRHNLLLKSGRALEYCVVRAQIQQAGSRDVHRGQFKRPKGAKKAGYPGFVLPTLATLRKSPPASADWLHEIKFDGYRLQAHVRSDRVKLLTRSGLDWTAKFGAAIAVALADLPVTDAIIDGEIVAENAAGAPDFSALQDALSTGRTDRLVFYAFDLLYLDGYDLRPAPLVARKAALEAIVIGPGAIRYSEHFEEDDERLFRHACRLGLEGVVSKVRNAPIARAGARSGSRPNARTGRSS